MERDLFRRCVRRVRGFLAPRWGNGRRGLRKFVRKLLAPFRDNPHILSELLRTPAKVLAMAGLAWSLSGNPNVAPAQLEAGAEALRGVPAATQQVLLTESRDQFASDEKRGEANLGTAGSRKEVAFIDLGVAMPDAIARSVRPGTEVHYIQANRSGIEQISEVLAGSQDIDAIHLLSHGGPGYVNLGTDVVNREILAYYGDAVRAWRSSLSEKADILVYGCEVARSEEGKAFLADISHLTGADVAGSDDVTGAKRLGGDWMLETSFGMVDVAGLNAPGYDGTLATFVVTNNSNSGAGSLRQAIIDANGAAGADKISFVDSNMTIVLNKSLPPIIDDVHIDGPSYYDIRVSGDNYYQIFDVYGAVAPGPTVTIDDLTIHYGYGAYGSAISNTNGDVTITNCTISNSTALFNGGAIHNASGTVALNKCNVSKNYAGWSGAGNGGAIANHGTLTTSDNTDISNNYAYYGVGGALYSSKGSSVTLTDSTVSYNDTDGNDGGGIWNDGTLNVSGGSISNNYARGSSGSQYGGGIFNGANGTATISDYCGINNNSAYYGYGGGIANAGGSVTLTDSYVNSNTAWYSGGGIWSTGTLKISGGTVDSNTAGWSGSMGDGGGIYGGSGGSITADNNASVSNNYAYYGDGGGICSAIGSPLTLTSCTVDSNRAHYHGGGIWCNTDLKIMGGSVSSNTAAWSYNYGNGGGVCGGSSSSITADKASISSNYNYYGYGGGIWSANGSTSTLTDCTVDSNRTHYTGGGIWSDGTLKISGGTVDSNTAGWSNLWGDGGGIYGGSGGSITADNSASISNNYAYYGDGGGICSAIGSPLTLTSCTVDSNRAHYHGGGIWCNADLKIMGGSVSSNTAAWSYNYGNGGGVCGGSSSSITADKASISSNYNYYGYGGGIWSANGSTSTLTDCTVDGNRTHYTGGGIWSDGTLKISGGSVDSNTAGWSFSWGDGGGIYSGGGGSVTADSNASISSNYANYGDGGGIFGASGSSLTLTGCTVDHNSAAYHGGGISSNPDLKITGGSVSSNTAAGSYLYGDGGGIHGSGIGSITVENATISNNHTYYGYGGGISNPTKSKLTLTNCTIDNNTVAYKGGGIWNDGEMKVSGGSISGNTAADYSGGYDDRGGGIYNAHKATSTVENTKVQYNRAYNGRGGAVFNEGDITLTNCPVTYNYARGNGGGFWNDSEVTINGGSVSNNYAGYSSNGRGGGFYNDNDGVVTATTANISNNYAANAYGGACFNRTGSEVTLADCTIMDNGAYYDGGAVFNEGTLKVTGGTVSGNTAYAGEGGGIYNMDTATLDGCKVTGNYAYLSGGGIYNDGTLTVTNSTISGNSTGDGYGGGIYNRGTATIDRSTVSNNYALYHGGGIYNNKIANITNSTISGNTAENGYGGGIAMAGNTLYVRNSTVSGNQSAYAGGGISCHEGASKIFNSTVANNKAGTYGPDYSGGGIYIETKGGPTALLRSTLVAGNTDSMTGKSFADISDPATQVTSYFSLIQDPNGHTIVNGVNNNIVGVDPMIDPLADNGGPTLTHALQLGSPAINMGENPAPALAFDQTGLVARDADGGVDIGAVELGNLLPVINSVTGIPNPVGVGILVTFAVDATDADGDPLTITWDYGDGNTGTGATSEHAYSAVGTYTVTVSVTDGKSDPVTATLVVSVVAVPPIAGTGPDSDGDGFSDSLETFVGSDPNSADSTPMNMGILTQARLAVVKKLRILLDLRPTSTGRDKIRLVGDVPIPDGFSLAGQEVILDIGGVQKRFTLDRRGRGKDGDTLITFGRPRLGFSRVRVARRFQGDYKGTLETTSNLNNATVTKEQRTVRVTLLFNGEAHVIDLNTRYTSRQNKRGMAKQAIVGGKNK